MAAACACKRGFFTLRDCENAAAATCGMCGRGVCHDHLAPRVDAVVCVECAARQEEQAATEPALPDEGIQDPARSTKARHRLRHRMYSSGYDPPFWGVWYGDYYSDYDMRHFDDDDAYEGGFGDS
jgi:hypothetical protein